MLTALLPIRIEENSFWQSSTGIDHLNFFLDSCKGISEIDQFVVITQDDLASQLAEQQGMKVSNIAIPGCIGRPYTFEQMNFMAQNFLHCCAHQTDALMLADHRNLYLTTDDISMFIQAYQKNPENGIVSLAFCRDYPCQFKAYFTFLDCVIIHFDNDTDSNLMSDRLQLTFSSKLTSKSKNRSEAMFRVSIDDLRCKISFNSKKLPAENFITQIIPFGPNGPNYENSQEIFIKSANHLVQLEIEPSNLKGIIFIFTTPSHSGEYDTMELFTPENAPWELGESISTVFSKKGHEPLHDRRQIQPSYTYDGSLCILSVKHLLGKTISNFLPIVLKDSCIVTDWVDYWHTLTAQQSMANLES